MYDESNVVAFAEDVFAFPTSFAQQRLWFLDQLQPGDHTYNIPVVVRLRGVLDVAALSASFNEVVRRHESLRTTFIAPEGDPLQVVSESSTLELPVLDLRDRPEADRELELQLLATIEAETSFDLAHGPLLRAVLVQMSDDDHVLLLTIHHIISDGWSMSVLISEVAALYTSFVTGQPTTLPELPIQYADYSVWQREWLQGEVLETQLSYWKQKLTGAPATVELPTDHPRPPVRTFRSATQSLLLDESLSEKLRVVSRRYRVTLFMTLLAAFKVLLSRYTAQEDIVVGSPIAGRNRAETKGVIGFFLSTLVLRTDVSGELTFAELLERVRETTVDAYTNQDVPFEKLLEELKPERDLSRTPLFQVFFNMLNLPAEEIQLPRLKIEFLSPPDVGAKFDLTLYVRELNQRIAFEAVYNADLYAPERMTEMLNQLEHLLSQVTAQPEQQIARLSLVTPSAEKFLPNPTRPQRTDWEGSVHNLFSRQAFRAPERVAVIDRHESWTYKDLDESSNQLANYLCDQGVGKGDVVAIYGHRSSALVWAVLGVMKSGSAFLILDPAYPAARLVEYLKLAEPAAWIHIEAAGPLPDSLAEYVSGLSCTKLTLAPRHRAPEQQALRDFPITSCGVTVEASDLAYLSFTSGSTGTPKAVEGGHGQLTHFIPWFQSTFGLNENDRFSMVSGISHDPLHRDVFFPLALGACVCIPEQEVIETQGRLAVWMKQHDITISNLTPAMAQLLVEHEPGAEPCTLTSLRYTFLVGDVLTKQDAASLKKLAPPMTCVNLYGATETQRAVGHFIVPDEMITPHLAAMPEAEPVKEILPLGKGIEDVQLLVLNGARQLAGIGEIGEIYMRSPHVARGYRHDDALTREKFLTNPFTNLAADRLYKTGDLGRYLPDGNVESLGRADLQVKIRGFRVELGEIEAVLRTVSTVREVVVIAREDRPGDKRLVAYIVAEAGVTPALPELREFLKQKLPNYMVPSAFVMLDALPLTPNMKVNRRALPPPAQALEDFEMSFVPARTRVEQKLVELWCEVLKLETCGVEDNFFDLGGHSLLAIQFQSRVRREFQVDVPLRRFFERPTVAGIAQFIEASEMLRQSPPLQVASRTDTLPLSFAQRRLWFLNQLEPDSPFYNINTLLHLTGTLDVAALEKTLNEIVRRHEVLRTSYRVADDEQPVQVIAPELSLRLNILDLRDLPVDQRESETQRLAAEEARRPFDLAAGPLLRACLIRLGDDEQVLSLTVHHIISDGWSMGVLANEVATLYRAFIVSQSSPLAELPVQYADFAVWQSQWLQSEAVANQIDYWKRQLADLPLLKLMGNKVTPAVPSYRGAVSHFSLEESLVHDLKQLSRREGVTLFMTLLAGFQVLLNRHSGQEDIVIGTDVANRFPVETEKLIGFFVNQLVLRTDLSNDPTFNELLRRVQDVTLEGYDNQDVPFDKVVETLRPDRGRSRTPLFQAKLVLQNAPIEPLTLPGVKLRQLNLDQGTQTAKFDLLLTFVEVNEALSVALEYSTDLFDAARIEQVWQRFASLLRDVVSRPSARLSEFADYAETERREAQMEQTESRVSSARKFKKTQPKVVSLGQGELIRKGHLSSGSAIPLVIEPQTDILDLAGWIANNWPSVQADLYKHGALLFRGFQLPDQAAFKKAVGATSVPLMQYMEGATPRTELGGKVYTSTEYPADQSIALHNELTYVMNWPMKIWFYCLQAAQQQGETPIADVRNVYRRLDPKIKERFADKGWLLVRNFGEGLSLPWQASFHLESKSELEAYCRSARIDWQWKSDDGLQTRQVRPAIAEHPVTGEKVWFNHVAFWHISSLEPQLREAMLALFGEENLAYNTYYGDGTPIEDSIVAEIREAYREETIAFPWQHGDLLMLDNMLVAHGRSPFVGPRKILVAMGEAYTRSDF